MRKLALAIAAALAFVFTPAGAAYASDNVNVGNSCNLSANWQVLGSVNYDHTGRFNANGSPIAFVDYVVINSPGPLTAVTIDMGRLVADGGDAHVPTFTDLNPSGNPVRYIIRKDPNVDKVFTTAIHVHAASGAACIINLDPPGI